MQQNYTIINFFESENKEYWLEKIKESDWDAGAFLFELAEVFFVAVQFSSFIAPAVEFVGNIVNVGTDLFVRTFVTGGAHGSTGSHFKGDVILVQGVDTGKGADFHRFGEVQKPLENVKVVTALVDPETAAEFITSVPA